MKKYRYYLYAPFSEPVTPIGVFRLDLATHELTYRRLGPDQGWTLDNEGFSSIMGDDARDTRELTEQEAQAWLSGTTTGPVPTNMTPPGWTPPPA